MTAGDHHNTQSEMYGQLAETLVKQLAENGKEMVNELKGELRAFREEMKEIKESIYRLERENHKSPCNNLNSHVDKNDMVIEELRKDLKMHITRNDDRFIQLEKTLRDKINALEEKDRESMIDHLAWHEKKKVRSDRILTGIYVVVGSSLIVTGIGAVAYAFRHGF